MGQLLEPIKIICYGPSLTKSIQLAQLQLVLIPVESLKDILTESSPIKLAATPLRSLQPGSCCTREVQRCESGLQMISDRIHLEKHFTAVTPKSWVITIKLGKLQFGKWGRARGEISSEIMLG